MPFLDIGEVGKSSKVDKFTLGLYRTYLSKNTIWVLINLTNTKFMKKKRSKNWFLTQNDYVVVTIMGRNRMSTVGYELTKARTLETAVFEKLQTRMMY